MRCDKVARTGMEFVSRHHRPQFMRRVHDRAGPKRISFWRYVRCGLPLSSTASAPQTSLISRLNTKPAHAFDNALRRTLRSATHDSRPVWGTTPLPYDSFIHYNLPVLSRR